MSDECIELKNIKYQTMLLSNNYNKKEDIASNIKNIDELLDMEKNKKSIKPWSKLEKMAKITKLYAYVDKIKDDEKLTPGEIIGLKSYLKKCLERKKIQRVKDISYDKVLGVINCIPGLIFTKKGPRRFTLKNIDKKHSILQNLTPIRKKNRHHIKKIKGQKLSCKKLENKHVKQITIIEKESLSDKSE
jgi:hypothetical protein